MNDTENSAPGRRRALPWVTVGLALLVLAADQGTKALALNQLGDGRRVDVVGDLFGFELVRNAGAAFSMATGMTWVLTLVALVVVIAIVRISRRLGSAFWAVALGLLLGGALGNLTDRLTREPGFFRGHVIDFLVLPHWPVFNVADSCIVTAAVLIALLSVVGIGIDGRRIGHGEKEAAAPTGPQTEPAHDVPNQGLRDRDG